MRIKFKGQDLGEWNDLPTLREASLIKRELGMLPMQFGEALTEMDPDATRMLVAIMMTRNGTPTKWEDIDGDYGDFEVIQTDDEQAAAAQAAEQPEDELGKPAADESS